MQLNIGLIVSVAIGFIAYRICAWAFYAFFAHLILTSKAGAEARKTFRERLREKLNEPD